MGHVKVLLAVAVISLAIVRVISAEEISQDFGAIINSTVTVTNNDAKFISEVSRELENNRIVMGQLKKDITLLSSRLNMTNQQTSSFLRILNKENISTDEIPAELNEYVKQKNRIQVDLDTLRNENEMLKSRLSSLEDPKNKKYAASMLEATDKLLKLIELVFVQGKFNEAFELLGEVHAKLGEAKAFLAA